MTPRVGDHVNLATRDGTVRMRVQEVVSMNGCDYLLALALDYSRGAFLPASKFTIPEREEEG